MANCIPWTAKTSIEHATLSVDMMLDFHRWWTSHGLLMHRERSLSPEAQDKDFRVERARLKLHPREFLHEVAWCTDYIALLKTCKTFRPFMTSYGYKHRVENYRYAFDPSPRSDPYISNGAFIAAAAGLGFDFKQVDYGPNCLFRFSKKSVDDIDRAVELASAARESVEAT